jgi:ABC-type multidrug transport system ATPase subunit
VIIMRRGKMIVQGTVDQLRSLEGMEGKSLEDIFLSLTHEDKESPSGQ